VVFPVRGDPAGLFQSKYGWFRERVTEGVRQSGEATSCETPQRQLPGELNTMAKEKNIKQVNVKKESTKSLKEKRAAKQIKREEKFKKEY
jgi:hypothetical protein